MTTLTVNAELGWIGTHELDVVAEWVPGELGSREGGKLMEPDYDGYYRVISIEHPVLSNTMNRFWLKRLYENDADFREEIDAELDCIADLEKYEGAA